MAKHVSQLYYLNLKKEHYLTLIKTLSLRKNYISFPYNSLDVSLAKKCHKNPKTLKMIFSRKKKPERSIVLGFLS